jgi:cell fate regulator YaaT (PSP1 superfamily)
MPTIVGVKLRNAVKPVLLDTGEAELDTDAILVVNGDRGLELGRVVIGPRELEEGESLDSAARYERTASDQDLRAAEELHGKERDAMPVYRRLVAKHGLDMKPIDVEYLFDRSKVVFYFVAEERVDFRDLVRDLAAEFHARIDMRQIGVRDEARIIGGLGHCGEQLCCVRFGGDFQPVSIRMAKEQDLPLNPLKISGLCGRLMCCLRYEFEAYKDFKGRAPRKGAIIEVGTSKGKVVDFNTPKETVTMRLEEGGSITVALADMECGTGQGCPCRVRAEALERPAQSLSAAVAAVASISSAKPVPSSAAPAASEESGDQARTGSRRRRRRSGSGGSQGSAETPAPAAKAAGDSRKQGERKAASKASTAPAQQQSGTPSATPGRRRRRRRSGGAGGATPAE